MASRSFERQEQRRKEERERRRAEERAEQRREEERERRLELERELQREEERRTEAIARERELDAAEERERQRRNRARAWRRSEDAAARREGEHRAAVRGEQAEQRREAEREEGRREASRADQGEQRRQAEREERRREASRADQGEQRRQAEREERRREAARTDQVEQRRQAEREEGRREAARTEQAEQRRQAEREEGRREAARTEQAEQRRQAENEEGRREAARAEQAQRRQEGEREEARREAVRSEQAEHRQQEEREEGRREAARASQSEQRREAERAEDRDRDRRATARGAEAKRRRGAHRAATSPGGLSWLRVRGALLLDEGGGPVFLRGVSLRGLERAQEEAGGFDPAADEDELALIASWGATAVQVPVAQDLVLYGAQAAGPEAYLQALDTTIDAAASAGLYVLLQLSLLSSDLPTAPGEHGDTFAPVLPDERSVDAWSLLARRYVATPAVLYDLFRAPRDPPAGDSTGDLVDQLRWAVWRRWLLALLGEIRRANPRALAIARGMAGGRDLSEFPLRYSDGSAVPNVVYGAELDTGDPVPVLAGLAKLSRNHPVGLLRIRPGASDADALERLQQVLARAGWHWLVDAWRDPVAPLVLARSPLRPTRLGTAVARGLAQPAPPHADQDRSLREGGGAGGHTALRMLSRLVPGQLPDAGLPGPPAPEPRSILVFYGFSGAPALPPYPDGTDPDQSFALTAKTIAATLRKAFPTDDVQVVQSWHKDKLIDALEHAKHPIRQVHVVCHGDSTRLSLSYHYDERFQHSVDTFNAMPGSAHARGLAALKAEDALVPGYFRWALEPARRDRIAAAHAPGASWQIWGCFAGYATDSFGDPALTPEQNAYLIRLGLGFTTVAGIAVEIATQLKVTCTAAKDDPGRPERGLLFWHGTPARTVEMNDTRTPPTPPFWLWNNSGSSWVTYGPDGAERPMRIVLGAPRADADLATGRPPKWLTDGYWK